MSAVVCGKRSHFDELHASPPIAKRHRCGNSPVRFSSRSSSPGAASGFSEQLQQLRNLFPHMDGEIVEKVLEDCGNNLDAAIKSLSDLCLTNEKPATSASPEQQQQQGVDWVELFVSEMLNANDLPDARARATRALEAYQKENETLKHQLNVLLKDNHILKRGLQIHYERSHAEIEEKNKEVSKMQQALAQCQEQIRALELKNYALTVHLRMGNGSSMPGHFHPDVF